MPQSVSKIPSVTVIKTKKQRKIKTNKKPKYTLQGSYQFQTLPISVENKTGSIRRSEPGHKPVWKTHMYYDYGYIRNTEASDGEGVDVYINKKSKGWRDNHHKIGDEPDKIPTDVYIIHQLKIQNSSKWNNGICPDCKKHHTECTCPQHYDEDKVMLGFSSKEDAIKAYLKQYDSPRFLGPVSTYTLPEFKAALKRSWGKKIPTNKAEHEHWHGVDLDGTLAKDDGWKGRDHIGEPIKKTRERIEKLLKQGKKVKIFTARAFDPKAIPPIKAWMILNDLPLLEITNKKDPGMISLEDDRAVQVRKNTGRLVKAMNAGNELRIFCTESAAISLIQLLSTLKTMGNHGASRSIKIDDYGRYDFDGDGSSKIDSITINGQPLKRFMKKDGDFEYPLLRKFIKSYGEKMEKVISAGPIKQDELREASKRYPETRSKSKKVVVLIPQENTEGINTKKLESAFGVDFDIKKPGKKKVVMSTSKSMLGTPGTSGDPGIMYPALEENISEKVLNTTDTDMDKGCDYTKAYTMSKMFETIKKAYPDKKNEGESFDDYTRRAMREMSSQHVQDMLNRGQGGMVYKSLSVYESGANDLYQGGSHLSPEYRMDQEAKAYFEEMYNRHRRTGEEINEFINRRLKEMCVSYGMFKGFVHATRVKTPSGKIVTRRAHYDKRRGKLLKVETVKRNDFSYPGENLYKTKESYGVDGARSVFDVEIHEFDKAAIESGDVDKKKRYFVTFDTAFSRVNMKTAQKMKKQGFGQWEALGMTQSDAKNRVEYLSDRIEKHNRLYDKYKGYKEKGTNIHEGVRKEMESLEKFFMENYGVDISPKNLEKGFVRAHTRKGKPIGSYFTKTKKKVTHVKHKALTRVDYGGKEAREKVTSLHKKKEHHESHIKAASELKEQVKDHKSAGKTTFMVGDKEHHIDKVIGDLNDHIDHHTNEKKSHDNHIRKIEKRRETEAKHWDKKREERKAKESAKKEAKTYDKAKSFIKDTLGSEKVTKSDVIKVMTLAKKQGDDLYATVNNYLMSTRPDLTEAINDAGVKLDAMSSDMRSAAIKEMLKDGQHEGKKFDEDMISVLERMGKEKTKPKSKKVVIKKPEIKFFTPKDSRYKPISGKDKEGKEVIVNYSPIIKVLKPKQKTKIGSLELTRENLDNYTLSKGKDRIFLTGRKDVEASIYYYNNNGKFPEQPKGFDSVADVISREKPSESKEVQYTIERYEPNPHSSKEPMLKNRTYQAFRWKEIERFKGTEKEANKYFHDQGFKGEYRLKEHFSDKIIAKPKQPKKVIVKKSA